jgi:small subunit ribosomal protein S8
MAFNDPIAELLTRLRNAKNAQHRFTDLNTSIVKLKIIDLLKQKGFIDDFLVDPQLHKVRIFLRYNQERQSVLNGLKRISTPGWRRYVTSRQIPRIFNGMGFAIVSTSRGILDGDTARNIGVGGELLCAIW